eukprot:7485056-Pyramimonas_sp.AAC.1
MQVGRQLSGRTGQSSVASVQRAGRQVFGTQQRFRPVDMSTGIGQVQAVKLGIGKEGGSPPSRTALLRSSFLEELSSRRFYSGIVRFVTEGFVD